MAGGWRAAMADAVSPSWVRRAAAGRGLASFVDVPEAAEALVRLLLDAEDTAVTRRTAEALAEVGTVPAVRLVALALAGADDQQADWLRTGVEDAVLGRDDAPPPDIAGACRRLARDPEPAVRRGAAEIVTWTERAGS